MTVHAPQLASSQPYFAPVRCDASRSAHSSGVPGSSRYSTGFPLTVKRVMRVSHSARRRSEEHTSELQSLMRISYAVFCLKKKKNYHCNMLNINTEHIINTSTKKNTKCNVNINVSYTDNAYNHVIQCTKT